MSVASFDQFPPPAFQGHFANLVRQEPVTTTTVCLATTQLTAEAADRMKVAAAVGEAIVGAAPVTGAAEAQMTGVAVLTGKAPVYP